MEKVKFDVPDQDKKWVAYISDGEIIDVWKDRISHEVPFNEWKEYEEEILNQPRL